MEVYGAAPNRAKAKCRKARDPRVSWPLAAKPNFRRAGVRSGDGVGAKFCVTYPRRPLGFRVKAVAVENERTRWQRDERSRMAARNRKAVERRP